MSFFISAKTCMSQEQKCNFIVFQSLVGAPETGMDCCFRQKRIVWNLENFKGSSYLDQAKGRFSGQTRGRHPGSKETPPWPLHHLCEIHAGLGQWQRFVLFFLICLGFFSYYAVLNLLLRVQCILIDHCIRIMAFS